MGKILTRSVKKKAEEIYSTLPDKFTLSFEDNKTVIRELDLPFSKRIQNIIAGYITRMGKQAAKAAKAAEAQLAAAKIRASAKPVSSE